MDDGIAELFSSPESPKHKLLVTGEGDELSVVILHCPKDESCAIYHECLEENCNPPDYEGYEEFEAHGKLHIVDTCGDHFIKDEPHNCAMQWMEDWEELIIKVREHGTGIYLADPEFKEAQTFRLMNVEKRDIG